MSDFRSRLITAIENSAYRDNKSALSQDIGKGSRYVSNLLNSPNPNQEPGLHTSRKLAECLGVSIGYLAGIDEEFSVSGSQVPLGSVNLLSEKLLNDVTTQARRTLEAKSDKRVSRPLIDDMIDWWYASGGRLENIDAVIDCVDIHHAPSLTDTSLTLGTLGRDSLASIAMGRDDPDLLRRSLDTISGDRMERLIIDYHSVSREGIKVSIEQVTVTHPETGQRIHLNYKRALMKIKDARGVDMVANYSKLI